MDSALAADPAHRAAALTVDQHVSFEVWPTTGELLVVWERMRPGLAMRSFVEHAGVDRADLDAGAPATSSGTLVTDETSLAMENGDPSGLPPTPESWAELIDFYVLLANRGQEITRSVTNAGGVTVLTGGGLRSRRWRQAKALIGRPPMVVSTVEETATRGCAAMAGVAAGWWTAAESMPGGQRVPIGSDPIADMEDAITRMTP